MATSYVITAKGQEQTFRDAVNAGSAVTYEFDFSPWAEDNNTVTNVTWEVDAGQAAISGEALASNVASALVTFAQSGKSRLKVTADTGAEKYVVHLEVLTREPCECIGDYWGCY